MQRGNSGTDSGADRSDPAILQGPDPVTWLRADWRGLKMSFHQYGFSPACKTCVHARACKMMDDDCVFEIDAEEVD